MLKKLFTVMAAFAGAYYAAPAGADGVADPAKLTTELVYLLSGEGVPKQNLKMDFTVSVDYSGRYGIFGKEEGMPDVVEYSCKGFFAPGGYIIQFTDSANKDVWYLDMYDGEQGLFYDSSKNRADVNSSKGTRRHFPTPADFLTKLVNSGNLPVFWQSYLDIVTNSGFFNSPDIKIDGDLVTFSLYQDGEEGKLEIIVQNLDGQYVLKEINTYLTHKKAPLFKTANIAFGKYAKLPNSSVLFPREYVATFYTGEGIVDIGGKNIELKNDVDSRIKLTISSLDPATNDNSSFEIPDGTVIWDRVANKRYIIGDVLDSLKEGK